MTHPFRATHLLILTSYNRTREGVLVHLDADATGAGAAYTREEWAADAPADWEVDEDGLWTFQGEFAPGGIESVEVHALGERYLVTRLTLLEDGLWDLHGYCCEDGPASRVLYLGAHHSEDCIRLTDESGAVRLPDGDTALLPPAAAARMAPTRAERAARDAREEQS